MKFTISRNQIIAEFPVANPYKMNMLTRTATTGRKDATFAINVCDADMIIPPYATCFMPLLPPL